jgi:phosphoglycolate phosphatase
MAAIRLVVFDIAGTVIEDYGEIVSAFSRALHENGITFSEDAIKARMGASKREVIRHFVEQQGRSNLQESVEEIYSCFRTELQRLYNESLVPIAGAEATFEWCRAHDIRIATTTGFYREISDLILEKAGWRSRFVANVSSSDVHQGRPAPFMIFRAMEAAGVLNVREVINVGDTPLDLQSGYNAGVRGVVGVLSGTCSEERLRQEPHTHIIASVAEIPGMIEREF